jgi:protein-tyrosine phosphatase
MRAAAERRGIHLPSRARQIELADFSAFDRILTMDDDNLRNVRSLARELGNRPGLARIESMTSHCRQHQASEVPDPYYGGEQGFEHVLDLLEDACGGLLESLLREVR